MNKISKQLIKIAKEANYTDQILKLNSQFKFLHITEDLNVKLKSDFTFGKIQFQSNAKTDWAFRISIFEKELLKQSNIIYELVQKLKQNSSVMNKKSQNTDQGDLYDEQTGKFIGIQLSEKKIKEFDWYMKELKQSIIYKKMPKMVEVFEELSQSMKEITNKYGTGKHGKNVAKQFQEQVDILSRKLNYLITQYQREYGKDLQKLPKKEREKLMQVFEQFENISN